MIFQHTYRQVAEGRKTNSRRVWKPGEYATAANGEVVIAPTGERVSDAAIHAVYTASGRVKWRVGQMVSVQPGRGRPAIYMMPDKHGHPVPVEPDKMLWEGSRTAWDIATSECFLYDGKPHRDAWLENNGLRPLRIVLHDIRYQPVQAITEADAWDEGCPWCKAMGRYAPDYSILDPREWYRDLWDRINTRPGVRWADNPDVWCLTFALDKS